MFWDRLAAPMTGALPRKKGCIPCDAMTTLDVLTHNAMAGYVDHADNQAENDCVVTHLECYLRHYYLTNLWERVESYVCHFVEPHRETGKIDVLTISVMSG